MLPELPLHQMSIDDKLHLMDTLWADLSQTPQSMPLPAWQRDILIQRKKDADEGKLQFLDWDEAIEDLKRELRKIRLLESAKSDLLDGYEFYERQRPGLGDYFIENIESDINSLKSFAGIHAVTAGFFSNAFKAFSVCNLLPRGTRAGRHLRRPRLPKGSDMDRIKIEVDSSCKVK